MSTTPSSDDHRIAYVDHDPLIPTHLGTDAPHVHVRSSDRCLRNPDGALCPSPAELRERVAALEAEVERLRDWRREILDVGFGYDDSDESAAEVLEWVPFWNGERAGMRDHAEAVEARLDAVRALAQEWRNEARQMSIVGGESPRPKDFSEGHYRGVLKSYLNRSDDLDRALDSDATASEPTVQPRCNCDDPPVARLVSCPDHGLDATVERITDDNGDELEHGADTDAEADQPQPTNEAVEATYEVAARFQDGEVFTPEQMARGLGVFDDEAPVLVARRVGDDEWLALGSGGDFIAEYEVWDHDDEPGPERQQGVDRTDTPGGQR